MALWAIAAFVLAGLLARSIAPQFFGATLGPVVLFVFLPALLFEAAWNLQWPLLRQHWKPIVLLAVLGVFVTAGVIGAACMLAGIPLAFGLLIGALLSATDPVAIVAVFRRFPVSRELATIIEGEALFNDGMAVVLYRAVLAAIALGAGISREATIAVQAVFGSTGGIAIGAAAALIAGRFLARNPSPFTHVAATLLCAYATYLVAEILHFSGVFATIAAGITLSRAQQGDAQFAIDERVDRFWVWCALAANAALFFLIGATLDPQSAIRQPYVALFVLGAIIVARGLLAYGLLPLGVPDFPRTWKAVVGASMVRGALSLALAINLPQSLPYRGVLVDVTFTVVAVTLALTFLTLPAIVRRAPA